MSVPPITEHRVCRQSPRCVDPVGKGAKHLSLIEECARVEGQGGQKGKRRRSTFKFTGLFLPSCLEGLVASQNRKFIPKG